MRKIVLISILFFFLSHLYGQVIYICSTSNRLYRLDIVSCQYVPVIQINAPLTDISFHPDGTLYAINSNGQLLKIDTLTGNVNTIYSFNNNQAFNSLTTSADGIIYTTGNAGFLYSYNKATNTGKYYGKMPYNATGDLTFYKGKLYAAAQNDRIILVDINNPPNSSIAVAGNIQGNIYGIVSYSRSCDSLTCYAISNGNSVIYEIDFIAKSLRPVCYLNITVGGGASTYEFYGSSPVVFDSVTITNPTCANNDGSLSINVSGGIAPVTYSINGINFQLSNTFSQLPSGNYQFIAKDANGCTIIDEASLINPDAPVIENIATVPATCASPNGEMNISVTGGNGMIGYSIDGLNYQTSSVFSQLSAGEYMITVQDAAGCMAFDSVEILVLPADTIQKINSTSVSCKLNEGTLTVLMQNGSGIKYSIDGIHFQNANHFDHLVPATYLITTQDANGCTDTMSGVIHPPVPVIIQSIATVDPLCNLNEGAFTITATGGTGMIQYSIDGSQFQPLNHFDHLSPSTYIVFIKDENGCSDTSSTLIHAGIDPSIKDIHTDSSHCAINDGILTITATGGTGKIQYTIDGNLFQDDNRFDSLAPMNYGIAIRDQNGCIDTGSAVIPKENDLFFGTVESTPPHCNISDGSIVITPIGATGTVQYSIDSILFQTSNEFPDLAPGLYTIDMKDDAGCQTRAIIEVGEPLAVAIDGIEMSPSSCEEETGSIVIHFSGGTGQLTVSFDGGSFQPVYSFQNLAAGDYLISVADENGCQADTMIHVTQKRCKIYIPNSFSPNQDNINDLFQLSTIDPSNVRINKYMIFDRWGNMVYSAGDFLMSDTEFWWDGTFRKMGMSPGVFAYYIEVEYEDEGKEIFKGDVTLVR